MAARRGFNFDDPEDRYWNESGAGASFFDDLPSKQHEARQAVDQLFSDATGDSPALPSSSPVLNRVAPKAVDELLTTRINNVKLEPNDGLHHVGSTSAFSECSASSVPSNNTTAHIDFSRLQSEHRKLQRHLETVRGERYRAADVDSTVRRLLRGEPVTLDLYRSLSEKKALLEAAVNSFDENAILTVLLFLRSSLSAHIFNELLFKHSDACEVFLTYLRETNSHKELADALLRDASMVELYLASREKEPANRALALRRWTTNTPHSSTEHSQLVKEWADLLERQIPIDVSYSHLSILSQDADRSSPSESFTRFPRRASLVGASALETLYYCALHHYDLPSTSFASPQSVRALASLSEREFVATCVAALVRQTRWPHVERLLTTRTLLGQSKLSSPFAPLRLLQLLTSEPSSPPPADLLCRVIRSVTDADERLRLAEKFHAHDVVIEALVVARDRVRLKTFLDSLTPHSPDAYKTLNALNNPATKWKN